MLKITAISFAITISALALSGCEVATKTLDQANKDLQSPTIQYMKEPSKGLCFAYVKKYVVYGGNGSTFFSIATVDCKAVGL